MTENTSSIPAGLQRTFEYTSEDYSRIILEDSLFDGVASQTADLESLTRSLKNLTIRECKQYLHAVTLSDYLRSKIIPRGLRIQKAPALGQNNSQFCDRWCEILNKCAFDLMTLVIQETKEQLAKTKGDILSATSRLDSQYTDKARLTEIKKEIEQLKDRTLSEIKSTKRKKFARDTSDYQHERVYFWRKTTAEPIQQPQREYIGPNHLGGQPEWPSTSSIDSSSSRYSNQDVFLGNPKRRHQHGGARRRGGNPQRGRNPSRNTKDAGEAYVGGPAYGTRNRPR